MEQDEIPDPLASDCFLVVDEAPLKHKFVTSRKFCQPELAEKSDPWETALFISAVDPDFDESNAAQTEQNGTGLTVELLIPLPKVFDWLYYCFFTKSEDCNTRYQKHSKWASRVNGKKIEHSTTPNNDTACHWYHISMLNGSR